MIIRNSLQRVFTDPPRSRWYLSHSHLRVDIRASDSLWTKLKSLISDLGFFFDLNLDLIWTKSASKHFSLLMTPKFNVLSPKINQRVNRRVKKHGTKSGDNPSIKVTSALLNQKLFQFSTDRHFLQTLLPTTERVMHISGPFRKKIEKRFCV